MAEYPRELVAQAEQRYLRFCLQKYAQFDEDIKHWLWMANTISARCQIGMSVFGIMFLAGGSHLGPGVAWATGGLSLSAAILALWLEVLACDSHARRCLPGQLGQYAEALITHPLILKKLIFSWRGLLETSGRISFLLVMAILGASTQRYDLAVWLTLNATIWVGVSLLRRRVIRSQIRLRAEAYLQRHGPTNPNHPRPVINEPAKATNTGGE